MKFKITALTVLICSLLLLCSCGTDSNTDDKELKIVATLFPQYDFARQIAGDRAEVSLLLPIGTESHSFDPSMSDIVKTSDADIFIYTGENMENWAENFITALDSDCVILDVSENIALSAPKSHDEHHDHVDSLNVDPHIWTSPKNAVQIVETIVDALIHADPDNGSYYTANAEKYISELNGLDSQLALLSQQANGKKLYFGGKFAFHYLVNDYGFECLSLYDSCSESAEPGAKRLSGMISEMNANKAGVIFYPELTEPKAAMSISENTSAKPLLLHSCHNLSKGEFEEGKTYLSIMYENLENIKEAIK